MLAAVGGEEPGEGPRVPFELPGKDRADQAAFFALGRLEGVPMRNAGRFEGGADSLELRRRTGAVASLEDDEALEDVPVANSPGSSLASSARDAQARLPAGKGMAMTEGIGLWYR